MNDQWIKFNFDWQLEDIKDVVGKAFLWYCAINKKYPKCIKIPMQYAGFSSDLLETKIDKNLNPGVFILGVE
jgi:hypothetical protein